jgi:bacteriorhodopsin
MEPLPTLTPGQFSLVYNMLSLAIAAMLGSFVFFVMARGQLDRRFRPAMVMSALVVGIAGYHYWRIFNSWDAAYMLQDEMYVWAGYAFNDAYRYVDWLLTVPLLVAELVAVLTLPKGQRGPLMAKLIIASALMIGLGYPGEVATDATTAVIWGLASTVPFVYILYVLWVELSKAAADESDEVKVLLRNTKLLLLGTWGFYPIVYILGIEQLGLLEGATAIVSLQVGYSLADITAKCGYGIMIYNIARARQAQAHEAAAAQPAPAAAPQPAK